jgi:glucosamine kinase
MNILIAESGSTKTDWRLINQDKEGAPIRTQGINPYYLSKEQMVAILSDELLPQLGLPVTHIYFYGAGCSDNDRKNIVADALNAVLPGTTILVNNDLLAASRSVLGTNAGIICILGTGSNACHFDGQNISQTLPNLGFWLGDEGSGSYMGKQLIRDFFHLEMPSEIYGAFKDRYGLSRNYVLERMYTQPFPNRYAASFVKFLQDHLTNPYSHNLVYQAFTEFIRLYVLKFENVNTLPINFCGSIAYHFSETLRMAAKDKGLHISKIIKSPVDGLVLYHKTLLQTS